jgi:hypothetical protein
MYPMTISMSSTCKQFLSWSVALLSLAISCICAAPTIMDTTVCQQFASQNHGTKLRYVKDSGICETTPGVHQVSGYVDIGKNMSVVRAISYISVFNNLLMVILLSSSGSLNLATHQNKLHLLYGVGIHVWFCYGLTEYLASRCSEWRTGMQFDDRSYVYAVKCSQTKIDA